jgi:hypothetical protein
VLLPPSFCAAAPKGHTSYVYFSAVAVKHCPCTANNARLGRRGSTGWSVYTYEAAVP